VAARQEFFPFFAGIANYRKPAAVKRRAFHNDGILMNRHKTNYRKFRPFFYPTNYRKSKSWVFPKKCRKGEL